MSLFVNVPLSISWSLMNSSLFFALISALFLGLFMTAIDSKINSSLFNFSIEQSFLVPTICMFLHFHNLSNGIFKGILNLGLMPSFYVINKNLIQNYLARSRIRDFNFIFYNHPFFQMLYNRGIKFV